MKDRCPKCGFKFNFRGPKKKIEKSGKSFRKNARYFCPSCSVEVFYHKPKLERYLGIAGYLGLGFGALIGILRMDLKLNALSKDIDSFFSVVGIFALGGSILLDFLNQHYKIGESSQPANSADAKDRAAD